MKKRDLNALAILGITSGLLLIGESLAKASDTKHDLSQFDNVSKQQNAVSMASLGCNSYHDCAGSSSNDVSDNEKRNPSSSSDSKDGSKSKDDGNLGYHLMTEEELFLELNDQGKALYNRLDAEGKALALKVASQRCDHTNECAGLNGCETEKNSCEGKGACKGQGKCAIADKNLAVKLVFEKMAKKRAKAAQTNH
jgi:hypothetical protein